MNTVKLVAVFAENRPGQAARITEILAAPTSTSAASPWPAAARLAS
jgi:hypothetical protein